MLKFEGNVIGYIVFLIFFGKVVFIVKFKIIVDKLIIIVLIIDFKILVWVSIVCLYILILLLVLWFYFVIFVFLVFRIFFASCRFFIDVFCFCVLVRIWYKVFENCVKVLVLGC